MGEKLVLFCLPSTACHIDLHYVETKIAYGIPFAEIIRETKECQIDLVVMGTHGRSGLSHAPLGSATKRVVRLSPVPVLIVRPSFHSSVQKTLEQRLSQ
jgi:hypothetical protein